MIMADLLKDLLTAVVAAAVPVITAFAARWMNSLRRKAHNESVYTESEEMMSAINDAVRKGVAAIQQTYVAPKKQDGTFKEREQDKAKNLALSVIKELLPKEVMGYIGNTYYHADGYLRTLIEAEVLKRKGG